MRELLQEVERREREVHDRETNSKHELETSKAHLEIEKQKLQNKLDTLKIRDELLKEREIYYKEERDRLYNTESELNNAKMLIEQQKKQLNDLEKEKDDLEREVKSKLPIISEQSYESSHSEISEELKKAYHELNLKDEEIREKEKVINDQTEKIEHMRLEELELKKNLAKAQTKYDQINKEYSSIKDNPFLKTNDSDDFATLHANYQDTLEQFYTLKFEKEKLELDYKSLHETLSQKHSQLNALKTKITEKESELNTYKSMPKGDSKMNPKSRHSRTVSLYEESKNPSLGSKLKQPTSRDSPKFKERITQMEKSNREKDEEISRKDRQIMDMNNMIDTLRSQLHGNLLFTIFFRKPKSSR